MRIELRKVTLRAFVLWGMLCCLMSLSFGMDDDVPKKKSSKPKINFSKVLNVKPSLEEVEKLQKGSHQLSPRKLTQWLTSARAGNFTGLYHLGQIVEEFKKNNNPLPLEAPFSPRVLKRANVFYWYIRSINPEDREAGKTMGLFYLRGYEVEKNIIKAFEFFSKVPEMMLQGNFSECGLTDEDAPQVASILSKAPHLTAINLTQNRFTSEGIKVILESLNKNPNLNELNVSHNLIGDEGGQELINFFEEKESLKMLMIYGNLVKPEKEILLNRIINQRLD